MPANNKQPRITDSLGKGANKPIIGSTVRSAGNGRVRIEGDGIDRYEGYLPRSLVDKYREGMEDPHLLHLRQEIALIDVRIKALTETIAGEAEAAEMSDIVRAVRELNVFPDDNDVALVSRVIMEFLPDTYVDRRSWARMRQMVRTYEKALDGLNTEGAERSLGALFKAIRIGGSGDTAWDEILTLMDMRRKLVATEVDREMRQRRLMDVEKVVNIMSILIRSLQSSVVKYIPDKNTQEAIFYDAEKSYEKLLSDRFSLSDDAEAMEEIR